MLDHTQTIKYINLAKNGDENAKTILIEKNSPLVKSIVKRYIGKGVDFDDLYQLGCLGFLKAIYNFDESFNVKFSTYAVPMIAGEIKRFLRDDGSIKVSRAIKTTYYQIQKYIDSIKSQGKDIPTIEEIAKQFEIEPQEVVFTLEASRMPISLYEQFDKDSSNSQSVIDKIIVDDNQEQILNKLILKDILSSLNEKDRKIIILRYFRDKTQSEIAQMLNVSQVQVSRLENKILEKMKHRLSTNEN